MVEVSGFAPLSHPELHQYHQLIDIFIMEFFSMSRTIMKNCKKCSTEFPVAVKEYNRQTKKGRLDDMWFCSKSCHRSWNNANNYVMTENKLNHLKKMRGRVKKGKYTQHLNNARNRKYDFDLDEKYLQYLWDDQEGLCALTNKPLLLREGQKGELTPYTASVDRIDNTKGYIKGNVQWVCYSANLAKQRFSDEEIKEFFSFTRPEALH